MNTPPPRHLPARARPASPLRASLFALAIISLGQLAPSLRAQSNLLTNPGFETQTLSGWNGSYGNCSTDNNVPKTGDYAGKVGYGSAISQTVTGLTPNTTYTLSGWIMVDTAGQVAYIGAKNHGGTSVSKSTNTTAYSEKTVTFTTGATSTSAVIFVYQSGTGYAFCDDLRLTDGSVAATGTQARRIADCLESFGVNTFSKLNLNGYPWAWGGSQGQYDAITTANAINYITADSGLVINIREYHRDYSGNPPKAITPLQKAWIRDVHAATGSPFSLAIGANGGAADIPGIIDILQDSLSSGLGYVKWIEGINEPNNNFGSGTITAATTADVQTQLYDQVKAVSADIPVAGPSIVFGLPTPDAWVTSYLGSYLGSVQAHSDLSNTHVYPPKSPNAYDGNSRGGTLADVDTGFANILPGPVLNTEWHPTLYSSIHKDDHAYAAYWGPIYLVSSFLDYDWTANFWFALFDYKATMKCGLFATDDTTPYPVADALRALYQLTGDKGAAKRSFAPDKLDVAVTGLPGAPANSPQAGGRWALFQNSARTYFLLLWNEQNDLSATTATVNVAFNARPMSRVREFNITAGGTTPLQTLFNAGLVTVNLDTSMRLLCIDL